MAHDDFRLPCKTSASALGIDTAEQFRRHLVVCQDCAGFRQALELVQEPAKEPEMPDVAIDQALADLQAWCGGTQRGAARQLDVDPVTFNRWVTGKSAPSPLRQLAIKREWGRIKK